ncbi:MAG: MBL fold metallo-hydrolase, partial [Bacteroidia bacterium]|nr:MBL fold metallo-hydrolase [Bacteroidia bacterium]
NEIKKQFPKEKIKAVITTSDAWPHVGGIREYAANRIPIYHLDLNEKTINRILKANFYTNPDSLQKKKVTPLLIKVTDKLSITDKENPLEILPIKTETGERMMMVYFPKHKLLYSSDLVQPGQGEPFFMPQYIGEIIEAVTRETLDVEKIIGMHQSLIEYQSLLEFMK